MSHSCDDKSLSILSLFHNGVQKSSILRACYYKDDVKLYILACILIEELLIASLYC